MQLEEVQSSNIGAVGYDAEASVLFIRFKDATNVYSYENIPPEMYEEMRGAKSIGTFFSAHIKPFKQKYPFRKLEANETSLSDDDCFCLFCETENALPADPESLKTAAIALTEQAKTIVINTAEAYQLAATTLLAIARMRAGLETTFRPDIQEKYAAWKASLAVLNYYDNPLEEDEKRLKQGISDFNRREEQKRIAAENAERERQKQIAEETARQQAQELQLADAIDAEQRGEPEIAEVILKSTPLPIAPAYVPPVRVASTVPQVKGITHRDDWTWDVEDINKVPRKYLILDERALNNEAKTLKGRADVPGIRFFDRGGISVSRRA